MLLQNHTFFHQRRSNKINLYLFRFRGYFIAINFKRAVIFNPTVTFTIAVRTKHVRKDQWV